MQVTEEELNSQISEPEAKSLLAHGIWPGTKPRSTSPTPPLPLREDLVTGAEALYMAFVSVSVICNFL